jgi:hypothetical protein
MEAGSGTELVISALDSKVERTVKPQGGCQRRDAVTYETVQVGVGRALNVKVPATDVVHGLVVHLIGLVGGLWEGVNAEHRVVGLNDGRDLWSETNGRGSSRLSAARTVLHT